jgi:hypothetical protein
LAAGFLSDKIGRVQTMMSVLVLQAVNVEASKKINSLADDDLMS